MTVVAQHRPVEESPKAQARTRSESGSLFTLFKSSLSLSILITVIPGLLLGANLPDIGRVFWTMLGTFMVASASFVYNQIIEMRTDALMERTKKRPLPAGMISPLMAHLMGSSLLGTGMFVLVINVNVLTAGVVLFSFLYYVFIYTALLKPRSPLNTVLGGAAGAVGPLIGEAAVRGTLSIDGWMMFLLLFLWQPPHFWCLGIRYREQYAAAGIPILPVARGLDRTFKEMLSYQVLLLTAIVLMFYPLGIVGLAFLIPSLGFGLFVLHAMRKLQQEGGSPLKVFFMTIAHMILWHLALTLDLYLSRWM